MSAKDNIGLALEVQKSLAKTIALGTPYAKAANMIDKLFLSGAGLKPQEVTREMLTVEGCSECKAQIIWQALDKQSDIYIETEKKLTIRIAIEKPICRDCLKRSIIFGLITSPSNQGLKIKVLAEGENEEK